MAENTINAAVSQMSSDTNKVLENLNNEIQNLSSSTDNIEIALETSISEAKKAVEFAQKSIEKGDLAAAVQSLNLVESVADIALTTVPSLNVLEEISLDDDFSSEEISALTSVAGQMAVEKVLDIQKMAGQINVVSKAGLDTTQMMKNLDKNGVGIGTTLTSLDNLGAVNIQNITGKENFQIENFSPSSFSSMDVVEIGMSPTMMQGALNTLPLGAATKALETLSKNPEKLSSSIDPSLITSDALAETIGLTTKSIANTMTKRISNNTINNIGEDLNLNEISNISNEITNQNALKDLGKVIQETGIENVSKNLEIALVDNLGITEAISRNASQISEALGKKTKNKTKIENTNIGPTSLEMPESLSNTSLIVGAAILTNQIWPLEFKEFCSS